MRQFCAKFGAKRRYLKKLAIDNQQVTDGGRVLLNPASATNNDITSCKTTSYVVFLILGCDKSATKVVWLIYYFDYKAFARDLFISDYIFEDGYVFRR